ncbi:Sensor protein RstB [Pluralibacter gergoviae]|nr:Sensor protein RstB [Pluralibacter gergoviae]
MKKLFVQFYLLLFVCFLVMTMLVGLVYKFTAERAGRQSLDDLMKSSLYLMRSELREIPPRDWNKTLKELDLNLSFDLRIEPLNKFQLPDASMQHLRAGDIVALDDQYTFIQRIPRSHYVLAVGPVPYLYYLHEMRLLDMALIAFIAVSLAFPVFIWMRPPLAGDAAHRDRRPALRRRAPCRADPLRRYVELCPPRRHLQPDGGQYQYAHRQQKAAD